MDSAQPSGLGSRLLRPTTASNLRNHHHLHHRSVITLFTVLTVAIVSWIGIEQQRQHHHRLQYDNNDGTRRRITSSSRLLKERKNAIEKLETKIMDLVGLGTEIQSSEQDNGDMMNPGGEESVIHTIGEEVQQEEETTTEIMTESKDDNDDHEITLIEAMKKQLEPKQFRYVDEQHTALVPHQFLHLHHMKTGGTSVDLLLDCAKSRLEETMGISIKKSTIHECSEASYQSCLTGHNAQCRDNINASSIMSYCAPLKDLSIPFGWNELEGYNKINSLSVFRHPVSRAWSMYRFQTRNCYKCKSLKEVYELIDQNSTEITPMCASQLMNHQTRNVLYSNELYVDEQQKAQLAIQNMKSFFTMVGITEDMNTTYTMLSHVFPWLGESVDGSNIQCPLQHANASPQNNFCGPRNTHMPLPDIPDDETTQIIINHNYLDMKLYDAVLEQFRIQKLALNIE